MNKIDVELLDFLKRLNFIFKNQVIFTECIKNSERFSIFKEIFGPFEKSKKYRLKFFIAKILIDNNILKVASSEKCDNIDIQSYAIAEKDDQKLIKRDVVHFLNRIKEYRFFLEKDVKDSNKPKIDLDRFNSYLSNVIDSRLLKLLRLSKAELTMDDERRLTKSEVVLNRFISKLINTWRNFYLEKN